MPRKAILVVAGIVAALVAVLAVACTDEADSESSASQGAVDQLTVRVQRNEMITALLGLGALPIHDIEVGISEGTVESNYIPDTREALRLLALTNWDPSLAEDAAAIRDSAAEVLAALEADDIEAAVEPAVAFHDRWHDFEGPAWNLVVADLPPGEGGPVEEDHGDGEEESEDDHDEEEEPADADGDAGGDAEGEEEAH